jgi:hypothetical protein
MEFGKTLHIVDGVDTSLHFAQWTQLVKNPQRKDFIPECYSPGRTLGTAEIASPVVNSVVIPTSLLPEGEIVELNLFQHTFPVSGQIADSHIGESFAVSLPFSMFFSPIPVDERLVNGANTDNIKYIGKCMYCCRNIPSTEASICAHDGRLLCSFLTCMSTAIRDSPTTSDAEDEDDATDKKNVFNNITILSYCTCIVCGEPMRNNGASYAIGYQASSERPLICYHQKCKEICAHIGCKKVNDTVEFVPDLNGFRCSSHYPKNFTPNIKQIQPEKKTTTKVTTKSPVKFSPFSGDSHVIGSKNNVVEKPMSEIEKREARLNAVMSRVQPTVSIPQTKGKTNNKKEPTTTTNSNLRPPPPPASNIKNYSNNQTDG